MIWVLAAFAQDAPPEGEMPGVLPGESEELVRPDRSRPPAIQPPVPFDLPEPRAFELTPGVRALHMRVPGVRKISVQVNLLRGSHDLDGWPTHTAEGTGWLLDAGSAEFEPAELSRLRDVRDVSLWSHVRHHHGVVGMEVPKERLEAGMELLESIFRRPAYPKDDVKLWVRDELQYLRTKGPKNLRAVAGAALTHAWIPSDHPYGARPKLEELEGITTDALAATHQRWLGSAPITVQVVGDLPWSEVEPHVKKLVDGLGGVDGGMNPRLEVKAPSSRVVAVDMPGPQAAIRLRMTAPLRGDEAHVPAKVVNFALGGSFLSRLNKNLREEKGLTYGSRSRYHADSSKAWWTVSVDVKAESVAIAATEIGKELDAIAAEGITEVEIGAARNSMVGAWNDTLQTASSAAGFYNSLLLDNESVADRRGRIDALEPVTVDAAKAVAQAHLSAEQPRVWVVVGERSALEPQFEKLGWTVDWIQPEQAILGTF